MQTKTTTLKLFCFLFLLPYLSQGQTIQEKADALLSAYYQQDLFTGTVLIAKNNKVVFEKSYGLANRKAMINNSPGTEYRIGSVSKPITALIILQLHEKKLLALSHSLSQYIPGIPQGDSVTIENLLNHTSGIPSITSLKVYQANPTSVKSRDDVLAILKNELPVFSPGSRYQYSNSNYILLSYIAEEVTGKSMAEMVRDFAEKLNMHHTGMDYEGRSSKTRALGYEAGPIHDYANSNEDKIAMVTGAGGIYSTAADLFMLDQALHSEMIISKASKEKMFTAGKGNYGLGWEIDNYHGHTEIAHSGSIEGFKAMLMRYPEDGTTIIFLSNYWNTPGPQVCESLKAIAFDQPYSLPVARNYINLSPIELTAFEGNYSFRNAMTMELKQESGLLLSIIKGQPVVSFRPLAGNVFYNKSNNAEIRFVKDEDGKISSLQLKKGKQEMEWKKLDH
ncbi:MAG: serine hydrolase domain-containing protein [Flavisolibacter sp.]